MGFDQVGKSPVRPVLRVGSYRIPWDLEGSYLRGLEFVDRTGIYRDRLRRVDGRWLFAERQVSIDQYPRF